MFAFHAFIDWTNNMKNLTIERDVGPTDSITVQETILPYKVLFISPKKNVFLSISSPHGLMGFSGEEYFWEVL